MPPSGTEGVDILVVAYGAAELLATCLGALDPTCSVTVVDNSSSPEVQAVAEQFAATYVDPEENLGFAGGVNTGISVLAARATPERPRRDILLLNPDATVSAEGIALLHRRLRSDDTLAAVAAAQRDDDGADAQVVWPFPTPMGAWIEAAGLGRFRRGPSYLIGSVLLLRKEALDDVGRFDERYFLYSEETDWQKRCQQRGWTVALCPEVVATHVGAGTGGDPVRREVHFYASHERFVRKFHGVSGWQIYRTGILVGALIRSVLLPGARGRAAARRVTLFRTGPVACERKLLAALGTQDGSSGETGSATTVPSARTAPPLRITHVCLTDNFAGVERYICHVANGMAERGHQVHVIGGNAPRMRAELHDAISHQPATGLTLGIAALGRSGPVDIVHVHMTAAETAAWVSAPLHRGAIVATRHFAQPRGSSLAARAVTRLSTRSLAAQVAISQHVVETVGDETILLPSAVDDAEQAPLTRPVVLMLQRLEREKAPEVGLHAWAESGLGDHGWQLEIAGTGALEATLRALADELGLTESVTFLGHVDDTATLLNSVSILLAPSFQDAFGLAVVEAMAHGVPIVAAASGGHLETVGEDGALVAPGDPAALATALRTLADDDAERHAMGARLRQRQQTRFSLPVHLDGLEAVYRSVVEP